MDETQRRGLARLMLRWPSARPELLRRVSEDTTFADLCGAYDEACQAAERWSRSPAPNAAARADEYGELARETEQDILRLLRYHSNNC